VNYYLLHTTYPILFLSVLASQLCIPVPAILFLMAAGAIAGAGQLSFPGILLVAILGCLIGDMVWFEAGRLRGKQVLRLLCALASDPSLCIRKSRSSFARRGLRILLIAKFVPGLDSVMPPLAGISGASRVRFLIYDFGGSVLWSGAYIGTGFLFAKQLDEVARYTSILANTLVLVLGLPLLFFFVWKLVQLVRMIRQLRPLYISPQQLKRRLDAGEKIAVIDLLRFEDDPQDASGIPGAIRADPGRMRSTRHIVMPEKLDLVLYCDSGNSFVSARVAVAMRKLGIHHIRVLSGGLAAWKALGFPLSAKFADASAEMERLGIEVFPPLSSPHTKTAAASG
jgi:membrane protein DedA with SNARE-associated domain/rhodanese-related sulfurtransferase